MTTIDIFDSSNCCDLTDDVKKNYLSSLSWIDVDDNPNISYAIDNIKSYVSFFGSSFDFEVGGHFYCVRRISESCVKIISY